MLLSRPKLNKCKTVLDEYELHYAGFSTRSEGLVLILNIAFRDRVIFTKSEVAPFLTTLSIAFLRFPKGLMYFFLLLMGFLL